jgi:hypothetical protein
MSSQVSALVNTNSIPESSLNPLNDATWSPAFGVLSAVQSAQTVDRFEQFGGQHRSLQSVDRHRDCKAAQSMPDCRSDIQAQLPNLKSRDLQGLRRTRSQQWCRCWLLLFRAVRHRNPLPTLLVSLGGALVRLHLPSLVDNLLHQQCKISWRRWWSKFHLDPRYFLSAEPTCQT